MEFSFKIFSGQAIAGAISLPPPEHVRDEVGHLNCPTRGLSGERRIAIWLVFSPIKNGGDLDAARGAARFSRGGSHSGARGIVFRGVEAEQ